MKSNPDEFKYENLEFNNYTYRDVLDDYHRDFEDLNVNKYNQMEGDFAYKSFVYFYKNKDRLNRGRKLPEFSKQPVI